MLRFYFVNDRQIKGEVVKAGTVLLQGELDRDVEVSEINKAVADGDIRCSIVSNERVKEKVKAKKK